MERGDPGGDRDHLTSPTPSHPVVLLQSLCEANKEKPGGLSPPACPYPQGLEQSWGATSSSVIGDFAARRHRVRLPTQLARPDPRVRFGTSDWYPKMRKARRGGLFVHGRYWARTSDLRLVEAALSQLS